MPTLDQLLRVGAGRPDEQRQLCEEDNGRVTAAWQHSCAGALYRQSYSLLGGDLPICGSHLVTCKHGLCCCVLCYWCYLLRCSALLEQILQHVQDALKLHVQPSLYGEAGDMLPVALLN